MESCSSASILSWVHSGQHAVKMISVVVTKDYNGFNLVAPVGGTIVEITPPPFQQEAAHSTMSQQADLFLSLPLALLVPMGDMDLLYLVIHVRE